jgi:hypothetical protein
VRAHGSHEVAVQPAHLALKAEKNQIQVQMDAPSGYWMDVILGIVLPPPPLDWPEPLKNKAADYIANHIQLNVDGLSLPLQSFRCRYIEEPLRYSSSHMRFEWVYSLPSTARNLEWKVLLYSEHIEGKNPQEMEEEKEETVAHAVFSGKEKRVARFTFGSQKYSVQLADVLMEKKDYMKESFNRGLAAFNLQSAWMALLLCLFLVFRLEKISWTFGVGVVFSLIVFSFIPFRSFPAYLSWLLISLLTGLHFLHLPNKKILIGCLLLVFSFYWSNRFMEGLSLWPFEVSITPLLRLVFYLALFLMSTALLLIFKFFLYLYYRRLQKYHESLADDFLVSHLRYIGAFLFVVGIINFVRLGIGR